MSEKKNENYLENVDTTAKNDYFYTKKRQKCTKCTFLGFMGIYVKYKFLYVVKYFKVC